MEQLDPEAFDNFLKLFQVITFEWISIRTPIKYPIKIPTTIIRCIFLLPKQLSWHWKANRNENYYYNYLWSNRAVNSSAFGRYIEREKKIYFIRSFVSCNDFVLCSFMNMYEGFDRFTDIHLDGKMSNFVLVFLRKICWMWRAGLVFVRESV